jgi:aldose 1-epimerase
MKIEKYNLKIPNLIEVSFLNYGGIIQNIFVPDAKGRVDDVVLGFDDPADYKGPHPYFGALIGRYANRIANGKFSLEGKSYQLHINNGPNSLHGGLTGFDRVFWSVQKNPDALSYTLTHHSPHLHEGYPGEVNTQVTYTVTKGAELVIDYKVTSDRPTPVNVTNHSYFNLGGTECDNILDHELWLNADAITVINDNLTPTGEIRKVDPTFDFRDHKRIGIALSSTSQGFDHNFILNEAPLYDPKARLMEPISGRMMEVFTTEPAIQFYSGNFLDGSITGKKGIKYRKHQGLCLETQHFPDSPNHPEFPSTIVSPENPLFSKTIYKFTARK